MKNILYVNSTVRKESRTDELARRVLKQMEGNITEIKLDKEKIEPLNEITLRERNSIINNKDYTNGKLKYAIQFANADSIVISAPFWDLSFPALLKTYIENIAVTGVTFKYSQDGRPIGLCKANEMYYISTAGGKFLPDFGYEYIKALCKKLFGIKDIKLVYAEGLDIIENDSQEIIRKVKKEIDQRLRNAWENE